MLIFHRETGGIFGGKNPVFNKELIEVARENGIDMPLGYYPATITKSLLLNDFKKFTVSYEWAPVADAWTQTKRVFNGLFGAYFVSAVKTFDEAVAEIELSASPGHPWNQVYTTKRECLAGEEKLLREIIAKLIKDGEVDYVWRGKRYRVVYWLTSPKSEIRTIDKLMDPDRSKRKVRTFMCADMIMHIVGYMLYSNQNDQNLGWGRGAHWSAVGLSPWHGGWNSVSVYLTCSDNSRKFKYFDVSHMEASLSTMIQELIYDVRNGGIDGYDNLKRFYLENLQYSYIIDVLGYLVMKTGKNPSGNYNTLTDNTYALIIVFLYTLCRNGLSDSEVMREFWSISAKMMGDDSVVPDIPLFDNIIQYSRELGFEFKEERPVGTLSEGTFLNTGFVWLPERKFWLPKPNFDKIRSNIYFNFKEKSWRLAYVKCCAYRKLGWAFPAIREEADALLNWISLTKLEEMKAEVRMDEKITFHAALAQRMSDEENEFLIFGDESHHGIFDAAGKITFENNFNYLLEFLCYD